MSTSRSALDGDLHGQADDPNPTGTKLVTVLGADIPLDPSKTEGEISSTQLFIHEPERPAFTPESTGTHTGLASLKHRKRLRKLGQNKSFTCPHEGCGKTYSRSENLYRHQLNRKFITTRTEYLQ